MAPTFKYIELRDFWSILFLSNFPNYNRTWRTPKMHCFPNIWWLPKMLGLDRLTQVHICFQSKKADVLYEIFAQIIIKCILYKLLFIALKIHNIKYHNCDMLFECPEFSVSINTCIMHFEVAILINTMRIILIPQDNQEHISLSHIFGTNHRTDNMTNIPMAHQCLTWPNTRLAITSLISPSICAYQITIIMPFCPSSSICFSSDCIWSVE